MLQIIGMLSRISFSRRLAPRDMIEQLGFPMEIGWWHNQARPATSRIVTRAQGRMANNDIGRWQAWPDLVKGNKGSQHLIPWPPKTTVVEISGNPSWSMTAAAIRIGFQYYRWHFTKNNIYGNWAEFGAKCLILSIISLIGLLDTTLS